jgi:hypothetical protein
VNTLRKGDDDGDDDDDDGDDDDDDNNNNNNLKEDCCHNIFCLRPVDRKKKRIPIRMCRCGEQECLPGL